MRPAGEISALNFPYSESDSRNHGIKRSEGVMDMAETTKKVSKAKAPA